VRWAKFKRRTSDPIRTWALSDSVDDPDKLKSLLQNGADCDLREFFAIKGVSSVRSVRH